MTQDPFASAGAPATATTSKDPFANPVSSGSSDRPKFKELADSLLMLEPSRIESVPNFNKSGNEDRVTTDITVLIPGPKCPVAAGNALRGFWVNQKVIVDVLKGSLRATGGHGQPILGLLQLVPNPAREPGLNTMEDLAREMARFRNGERDDKPPTMWQLTKATPEQHAVAMRYWTEQRTAAQAA